MRAVDGQCCRLRVGADATFPEIVQRLEQEQELPPFHEIRLLQSQRELVDGATVEVELEAAVTLSPSKAFSALESLKEAMLALFRATRNPYAQPQEGAAALAIVIQEGRSALAAAEALGEMDCGWTDEHGEKTIRLCCCDS